MKLQSFAYPGRPFVVVVCCRWGRNSVVEAWQRQARVEGDKGMLHIFRFTCD